MTDREISYRMSVNSDCDWCIQRPWLMVQQIKCPLLHQCLAWTEPQWMHATGVKGWRTDLSRSHRRDAFIRLVVIWILCIYLTLTCIDRRTSRGSFHLWLTFYLRYTSCRLTNNTQVTHSFHSPTRFTVHGSTTIATIALTGFFDIPIATPSSWTISIIPRCGVSILPPGRSLMIRSFRAWDGPQGTKRAYHHHFGLPCGSLFRKLSPVKSSRDEMNEWTNHGGEQR